MRQCKTALSIIFILLFIWEAEFFILDILPYLKSDTQTVFAQNDTSPGLGQTTPSINSEPLKVVINEIAWMGTDTSPNDEWIELLNNSDEDINLNGWILRAEDNTPTIGLSGTVPKKAYFLLERTNDNTISDIKADKIYTGALEDSGEELILLDKNGTLIDQLNNSGSWFAGNKNKRITMERIDPQGDSNDPNNWANNDQKIFNGQDAAGKPIFGTPKQKNSVSYPKEEPPSEENPNQDTTPAVNFILINELLPDPEGEDKVGEFIELFNNSDTTAYLDKYELQDQSGDRFLIGLGTTIPTFSYLAFYPQGKIYLNNGKEGDVVRLVKDSKILEEITYIGPAPKNQSYNRLPDNTWTWSTTTTPGLQNIITTKDDSTNAIPNKSYPRHIWINEFFPNPKGKDAENEFIEIYNKGPDEIDLNGWQIDDCENKGSHPHKFPAGKIIKAGEYLSLPYSDTKIALNNDHDCVRLLWPDDTAIDEIEYENPPEAESYNKKGQGWCWSTTPTPGEQNNCSGKKPEKEEIKEYSRALWINEFLPDPKGKDEEGEFIELQNRGEEEIDLIDWQIDDCENAGSKPHTFPENTTIKANSYLVLYYKETKISLNNNGDCVRLLNPAGQAVDEIKYGKAKEGQSYSRQNVNHWQWTDNPTPYKDNEFKQILAAKAEGLKTPKNQTEPNQQKILPQTGPNMYFYYSPIFLFFFTFYLTKFKKYYIN